jgi:hypothetical protein
MALGLSLIVTPTVYSMLRYQSREESRPV